MKQNLIWVVAVFCVICLLIATIASISRAKNSSAELQPPAESDGQESVEQPSEENTNMMYQEYTGQAHAGTGIAYRGKGENAAYVIVIDAGHQLHGMSETEPNGPGSEEMKAKVTGGTRGSATGLAEYELNLRVALALRDLLVEQGYTVVMVRETNEVEISNAERAQLANAVGADVNIRIHANGDADASVQGAMTICQTPQNPYNAHLYEACRALSDAVLASYCESTGIPARNVWETDTMTGTNWATVPTTIIEMGFMTNAEEDAMMAAEGFALQAAQGLCAGIAQYLQQRPQSEPTTAPEQSIDPDASYQIDYALEAELGQVFTDVNITVVTTGTAWVRTEPSTRGGASTRVEQIDTTAGHTFTCIGWGTDWHRLLIDGKVYYMSAEYLQEVTE